MKLKICYFGTPDFSARFLEKMILDKNLPVEVVLVMTQPDRPVGRKKILTPSPVKILAKKYGIEVFESIAKATLDVVNCQLSIVNRKIDLCLLYAYGELIPPSLLQIPNYGFWNIHPSLLPKYRGPAPMAYPLTLGEKETGVTLMKMDEEVDHGPIIAQKKYKIKPDDKRSDLEIKLTDLGFEIFKQKVKGQLSRPEGDRPLVEIVKCSPQAHNLATYTRQLTKQDGFIPLPVLKKAINNEPLTENETPSIIKEYYEKNLNENCKLKIENSSKIIFDYFRGLHPWPGIWTLIQPPGLKSSTGEPRGLMRLKLLNLSLKKSHVKGQMLNVERVQLEGKTEVSFEELNRVYKIY